MLRYGQYGTEKYARYLVTSAYRLEHFGFPRPRLRTNFHP